VFPKNAFRGKQRPLRFEMGGNLPLEEFRSCKVSLNMPISPRDEDR